MNSVFLSPHFPTNFYNFAVHLRAAGANVLGIADENYPMLNSKLRESLTEYYRVNDMHNYDELVRALGYFTHKYGKLNHLDSHNEYWLETDARLRTDFNIPGIRLEQIPEIKRKSEMKRVFQETGLKVARGAVGRTREELLSLIREFGFPVVAKPDVGVGAATTYKLEDDGDVERFLSERPPVDFIIEEFVTAPIHTFDGLADAQGNLIFCSSLSYNKGVMDAVNDDTDIYYSMTADIDPAVEDVGRRILKAFGVRSRFFHFELFCKDNGEIMPLEVNMRPPGGLTLDMFNYLFEFDCYKLWAEMIVKGVSTPVAKPQRCVIYIGRKDNIQYSMSHADIINTFGSVLVHHERISPIMANVLGDDGYVLRNTERQWLIAAAETIQQRYDGSHS